MVRVPFRYGESHDAAIMLRSLGQSYRCQTHVVSAGAPNSANAFKNIVYRLDPNTLQAISPANTATRTANGTQATGTGTDVREIGVKTSTSAYEWRNLALRTFKPVIRL